MDGKTIVIDIDEKFTKVGIASEQEPKITFETKEGASKNGEISDIFAYEETIKESIKNLDANAKNCPVLITDGALDKKVSRERIASILFDRIGSPSIFIGYKEVMALYAAGHMTGISVYIGSKTATIIPQVDGYSIPAKGQRCQPVATEVAQKIVEVRSQFQGKAYAAMKNICVFGEEADKIHGAILEEVKKQADDARLVTKDVESIAWRGGSLLATMPAYPGLTVSKNEYEIDGMAAVHAKIQ